MTTSAWNASAEQKRFIRHYAGFIDSGDAALFAGAGLSRAAGYVDWRALLRDIAAELRLDVDREADLVALAQYHVNEKRNRSRINQVLIDELTRDAVRTPAHAILSRLPVDTVWTTNYDQLLEHAFTDAGKSVDVKLSNASLAQTRRGRDVTLFKMHGCVTQPEEAVLTKDDYESYHCKRSLFADSLKGDLIAKTFLFLGFSFADPNIDHILGRVKTLLGTNQREHFCVMRRPPPPARKQGKPRADYEYDCRKAELQHADLLRFGIETVWIDEFEEVEHLLRALAAHVDRRSVFVSGAARETTPLGSPRLEEFGRSLGRRLIGEQFKLVSGFGRGLGEQCMLGALDAVYHSVKALERDRVLVRPFPRATVAADQAAHNSRHREDLLSRVGAVIVVAGNKLDAAGQLRLSAGVFEEVEIALRLGKFVIPVGASGHVAEQIWQQAMATPGRYLPGLSVRDELKLLGDGRASNEQLLNAVFSILHAAARAVSAQ